MQTQTIQYNTLNNSIENRTIKYLHYYNKKKMILDLKVEFQCSFKKKTKNTNVLFMQIKFIR